MKTTTRMKLKKECVHSHQYTRSKNQAGPKSVYVPKNVDGFDKTPPSEIIVTIEAA